MIWEVQRIKRLKHKLHAAKYALDLQNAYAKDAIPNGWPMSECASTRRMLRKRIATLEAQITESINELRVA